MSCAGCGKAASETTTRLLRCNACKSVEYCDRDCQVSHWREHKPVCKDIVARITLELRTRGARLPSGARLPKVLSDAATSIQAAAHAGDLLAVKQLVAAGANVEEVDAQGGGTALYAAAAGGQIEVVKYLAEDCGANLSHLDKWEASMFHTAGVGGYLEIVRYLNSKVPKLIDVANCVGATPVMYAAQQGHIDVVRYYARHGCDLHWRGTGDQISPMVFAKQGGHQDIVRLLEDIDSAGGWRRYAAARRMAYVRIRHEVSKTYKMIPKKYNKELRSLYHLVFGKNRVVKADEAQATSEDREAAVRAMGVKQLKAIAKGCGVSLVGCLEKTDIVDAVLADGFADEPPTAVLPEALFIEVCKFLE